jgi:hypothetical protein
LRQNEQNAFFLVPPLLPELMLPPPFRFPPPDEPPPEVSLPDGMLYPFVPSGGNRSTPRLGEAAALRW